MFLFGSHVQMCELRHKEGWVSKNWHFLNRGAGEDSWESLRQQGYQTSQFQKIQHQISITNTAVEAEVSKLWPPDVKSQLTGNKQTKAKNQRNLMLEKIEGKRRREWQRIRKLDSITDSVDTNLSKLWEIVKDREAWHAIIHGFTKIWTYHSDWTTMLLKMTLFPLFFC